MARCTAKRGRRSANATAGGSKVTTRASKPWAWRPSSRKVPPLHIGHTDMRLLAALLFAAAGLYPPSRNAGTCCLCRLQPRQRPRLLAAAAKNRRGSRRQAVGWAVGWSVGVELDDEDDSNFRLLSRLRFCPKTRNGLKNPPLNATLLLSNESTTAM